MFPPLTQQILYTVYVYCLFIHPVRNRKIRCFTIFKIKVCSPPWPSKSFIPYTCIVYLHNICKREAGSRGGTIFSKPNKMNGQTQVWKKYTQITFKMGSRSPNHSQMFASCHLCKLVQDYHKYRNSFNIIGYENNSNQRQQ